MGAETTITADFHHGAWVVRVAGALDAHGVLRVCSSLRRLTLAGTHEVVVDLHAISDADPDALAALASAGRIAERSGLGFAVVAPAGAARDAVAAELDVCADELTALAHAAARSRHAGLVEQAA